MVDASDLVANRSGFGSDDVLNGIAHDPATGRFLLTGMRSENLLRDRHRHDNSPFPASTGSTDAGSGTPERTIASK